MLIFAPLGLASETLGWGEVATFLLSCQANRDLGLAFRIGFQQGVEVAAIESLELGTYAGAWCDCRVFGV